jgi:hypothetical protein
MQLAHITIKVASSVTDHDELHSIQHCFKLVTCDRSANCLDWLCFYAASSYMYLVTAQCSGGTADKKYTDSRPRGIGTFWLQEKVDHTLSKQQTKVICTQLFFNAKRPSPYFGLKTMFKIFFVRFNSHSKYLNTFICIRLVFRIS